MKKILILLLFCGFWANAQQYHDKGAKFENATSVGDTITDNTRIPIIDEFGLINYYVDVADLLALNPAPVLEWGNITGTLSDQTDLQGALNDKADQSALTAHTSNGNIHFTQSAISITESQVSDLKDYLRGDINDTNGTNKLTLGSLEVVGQTTLQNGLNLTSIPVGTSDNILTLNQSTGDVEQRVFSLGDIDIANEAGVSQFPVGLGDQLRIQGSGDTSISFDGITNTINIHSTPGSGGGGAVTSFNGRDGAVVSQAGDYSTAMVNENTNLYFTEARVRGTDLTGLTVTNTPISSTNTFIQALGRLQGQINDRITGSYTGFDSRYVNVDGDTMTGALTAGNGITVTGGHLNLNDFRRVNFGNSQDAYITYDGSGNRLNMILGSSLVDFRILDGSNPIMTIDRLSNNTTFEQTVIGNNGFRAFGSLAPWFDAIVTNNSDSNIFRGRDSNNNTVGSITTRGFNGSGGGYLSLNGEWRINENSFWHSGNFTPSDYYLASNPNGYTSNTGTVMQVSGGTGIIGNVTSSGSLSIDSGYTGFDARYYTETEADNRFLNSSGGSLSGTTTVTAGHFNLNDFRRVNFGSSQDAYISYDGSGNRFNMILEPSAVDFRILDGVNERFKIDRATGNTNVSGTLTASNLSGTNTGDQTAGTGLSGTSTLSITNIAAGSSASGALRYNGTIKSAGRLYGGSSNPSNTTRLNYDGHLFVSELTSIGDVTANSDKRLKKNIKRIDNALAIVQLLGGYEYDRKDIDLHQAGVIAQEVEEVFPVAVSEDANGTKSVAYNQLIALLIEAVKEQQIEIEKLKNMINEK